MPRPTASVVIIIAVFMLTLTSGFLVAQNAVAENSNFSNIADMLATCTPVPATLSDRMVVLRVDDIQAFGWFDVSQQLIQDSLDRQVPLVLGVIPRGLSGTNPMYRYLKKVHCAMELAQHGWTHQGEGTGEEPEFRDINQSEAETKIMLGENVLRHITDQPIMTFIPPENKYSTGTVEALRSHGFRVISSEGKRHFDYTATTYDFPTQEPVPVEKIVKKCNEKFKKTDVCVVMIHPQDFATDGRLDPEKYRTFTQLLDAFKKDRTTFVRFRDIIANQKP